MRETSIVRPELPEPWPLTVRGTDEVVAYACRTCGAVFSPSALTGDPEADEHAARFAREHCDKTCDCGAPLSGYALVCVSCRARRAARDRALRYVCATKLRAADYDDGAVYWEDHAGSKDDGLFPNLNALTAYCDEARCQVPVYVWACRPIPLAVAADDALERALSEHPDGADVSTAARAELQALLDAWCAQQSLRSWRPDYTRAVVLAEPDGRAEEPLCTT
jgi:hypothetical protein